MSRGNNEHGGLGGLHVGLLTPAFAGVTATGSGIGVHFRQLAAALTTLGVRVTVVVPVAADCSITEPASPNIVAIRVAKPALAAIGGRVWWQWHQWFCERALMRAATRAVTASNVHVWETTSTGALPLEAQRRKNRAPILVRISTTARQLRTTNRGAATWIAHEHERWETQVVCAADALVTHSETHRQTIAREFGLASAAIAVIPHAVDIPQDGGERERGRAVRALYVGRLENRKGVDLLLEALPPALARVPTLTFTFVGADAGAQCQRLWERTAPADVRDRVTFAGVVSDDALRASYRDADFLVGPSRYESFGLMFAEAMAWSLPVIALRAPGAQDLVLHEKTGLLVSVDDVAGLTDAISTLAQSAERRREMGRAAREHAIRHWSPESLATASVALYRKILAGNRTTPAPLKS